LFRLSGPDALKAVAPALATDGLVPGHPESWARTLGLPSRFLWYQFSPYEAYLQVGRYEDVITLADAVLAKKSSEEAFYYKGLALEGLGETEKARVQIALAVRYNRNYEAAKAALVSLEN